MPYRPADRERWLAEDPALKPSDRDDFARDRARVVHSASLRRLSAKTQVVAPDSDDFVRNRLTHSLEVAQIGREFGAALGCNADVVDAACLAHDLGHPPFGHNGETALDEAAREIGGFEGNAQTLRLLTRLEAKRAHADGRPAGLNLTRATLDAATKYPWRRGEGPVPTRKFGVYPDDEPVFGWLRAEAPSGRKCLEAQVMDFADDVAYSVHDVEDAIASGRLAPAWLHDESAMALALAVAHETYAPDLTLEHLAEAHDILRGQGLLPRDYRGSRGDLAALKDITSRLIGRFVRAVEAATRQRYGAGDLVRYDANLVVPTEVHAQIAVLKGAATHFVMNADERVVVMAEQRALIHALVEQFLERPQERMDADLWGDFAAAQDDAARRRAVIDQVASLTDARARALHVHYGRPRGHST